jgi:sugar O-acyltransferase (sialic acid O-acetyltransferase NeuD family)
MSNITPILVPKETVSDDHYRVVDLPVESGQHVEQDETLSVLETSKATFEITSPGEGFVHYACSVDDHLPVGSLFAVISDSPDFPNEHFAALAAAGEAGVESPSDAGIRISRKARVLMERHGVDPRQIAHLGVVRAEDVERFVAGQQGAMEVSLGPDGSNAPPIVLLGGGGHAKMCIDILRQTGGFQIVGILDRRLPVGSQVLGVPVIGDDSDEALAARFEAGVRHAVNGVGASLRHELRAKVYERLVRVGFALPNLVHPAAAVEPSAEMGQGNQVMGNATIGSAVVLGDNCIVNAGSVVSHDSVIRDHVHIAPGATLAGGVTVGENTLIGMGVTVFLGVSIGSDVRITNGKHVFKDVAPGTVVKA